MTIPAKPATAAPTKASFLSHIKERASRVPVEDIAGDAACASVQEGLCSRNGHTTFITPCRQGICAPSRRMAFHAAQTA